MTIKQGVFAALIAASAASASAQTVTYKLGGASDISFEVAAQGFIAANTTFLASDLTQCHSPFGSCSEVQFYPDAFLSGLTETDLDLQGVSVSAGIVTSYFYFAQPAFTTTGTHADRFGVNSLQVSAVPEASALSLLVVGLAALGLVIPRVKRADRHTPMA